MSYFYIIGLCTARDTDCSLALSYDSEPCNGKDVLTACCKIKVLTEIMASSWVLADVVLCTVEFLHGLLRKFIWNILT